MTRERSSKRRTLTPASRALAGCVSELEPLGRLDRSAVYRALGAFIRVEPLELLSPKPETRPKARPPERSAPSAVPSFAPGEPDEIPEV